MFGTVISTILFMLMIYLACVYVIVQIVDAQAQSNHLLLEEVVARHPVRTVFAVLFAPAVAAVLAAPLIWFALKECACSLCEIRLYRKEHKLGR